MSPLLLHRQVTFHIFHISHAQGIPLESDSWKMLDARLQSVLDWALGVADEWKESTRLDVRRSFKAGGSVVCHTSTPPKKHHN